MKSVSKAVLALYRYRGAVDLYEGLDGTYSVHRALQSWDNSTTWTHATSAVPWTSKGGDFEQTGSSVFQHTGKSNGWHVFDVTAAVNDFLKNPASNNGFIIQVPGGTDAKEDPSKKQLTVYYSSDSKTSEKRPKLTLTEGETEITMQKTISQHKASVTFRINSDCTLSLEIPSKGIEKIELFSGRGCKLFSARAFIPQGTMHIPVVLTKGMYIIVMTGAHIRISGKIPVF